MAYADDELDAHTRASVDAAMASDPELARRVARHKALRNRVHSTFNKVLDEPVPARLLQVARTEPVGSPKGNGVPWSGRQVRRWSWPQWTAIAASLCVGVIVGRLPLLPAGNPGPIIMSAGHLLASGSLATALSDQLASDHTAAESVRMGISFRSQTGEYCRTFTLSQPEALAGVACRAPAGWQLGVLARVGSPGEGSGSYRQAASSLPPAVVAAVSSQIAGEPLDARGEVAARARHWQP